MDQNPIIKAILKEERSADFSFLRKELIAYAQQASGKVWTDYNIHDPGVTLLEAVAYAITDVAYRLGLPIEKWLYHKDTEDVVRENHLLFSPEQAFTPRAVTVEDYRILLLDRFYGQIEQAYVIPERTDMYGLEGLYCIDVIPKNKLNDEQKKALKAAIKQVFLRHRNVGEDLSEVKVLQPKYLRFDAHFTISSDLDPHHFFAEVLFTLEQFLNPKVRFHSYDELKNEYSLSIEAIFDRPSYANGFILAEELQPRQKSFRLSRIRQLVGSLRGTQALEGFSLFLDGSWVRQENHQLADEYYLSVADFDDQWEIQILQNGYKARLKPEKVQTHLAELHRLAHIRNHHPYNSPKVNNRKAVVKSQDLQDYIPIAHELPGIYRVGSYAPSERESEWVQQESAQLEDYLSFFDEILKTYLERLLALTDLYSVQPLEGAQFADLEGVQERVYAHLLARMGEYDASTMQWHTDSLKQRQQMSDLLRFIRRHSRFDTGGMRYHLSPDAEDFFPMRTKIGLLQALSQPKAERLAVPSSPWLSTSRLSKKEQKELHEHTEGLNSEDNALAFYSPFKDSLAFLMAYAQDEVRYELIKEEQQIKVFFESPFFDHKQCIGQFTDRKSAKKAIKDLIDRLGVLEQASEGIHLIEHILLRPKVVQRVHFELYSIKDSETPSFSSVEQYSVQEQKQRAEDAALLGAYKNNYRISGDEKSGYKVFIKDLNAKDRACSVDKYDTQVAAERLIEQSSSYLSDLKNEERLSEVVRIKAPKEYHLQVLDKLGTTLLKTAQVERLDVLQQLQLELTEALQQQDGYRCIESENSDYTLHFEHKGVLFTAPERFATLAEAELEVEKIKKVFRSIRPFTDVSIFYQLKSVFAQKAEIYNHKVSCVYPSWVPRFQQEGQIERLMNCLVHQLPAGVQIMMCPMNSQEMGYFEEVYYDFLSLLRQSDHELIERQNERAAQLLGLLTSTS